MHATEISNFHKALKSSPAFHEQSLERARAEDDLKRKIQREPAKSNLIKMHISENMPEELLLQSKLLQLKKARLVDGSNTKITHRPAAVELIHKHILPVDYIIEQVVTETQLQKASRENFSCDEDSSDSLSPGQTVIQNCPLVLGPSSYLTKKTSGRHIPSPTQILSSALPFQPVSSAPLNLSKPVQRTSSNSQIKPKLNSNRLTQKHKTTKDSKPKVKKLKYHQYIHPDQKGGKEPPTHLDSSYSKFLQQQQLLLQLQILSHQQPNKHQTVLPAPNNRGQKPSLSSTCPSVPTKQHNYICLSSASLRETLSSQPNLDRMKVAELKMELKLRSLPISGTRKDLIERLRTHQELNQGSDTTSTLTAGGSTEPGPERAGTSSKNNNHSINASQEQQFQHQHSSQDGSSSSATPQQVLRHDDSVQLHIPQCSSLDATSQETSKPSLLGEQMNPPLTELSSPPSSVPQLPANIKEEPRCSTPPPCQFSLKSASLHKHRLVSSAAPTAPTTASSVDKDRMLQEKDKQIAELTRMLRQKQRLVEELKILLEKGKRESQVSELPIPPRVKEEPPNNSDVALSTSSPPLSPQISSVMDDNKVIITQEASEAEIGDSEVFIQASIGLQRSLTRTKEVKSQIRLQRKPVIKSLQNKQEYICLRQSALQLDHQQAVQKLLLQQQHIHSRMPRSQQKLCQQRPKKPRKLQLRQQEQQRPSQSEHQQQMQLKQQTQKQMKQQQHSRTQAETNLTQQQVSQSNFNQQSSIPPPFLPDGSKKETNPTLDRENEEDFIAIILQAGETPFKPPSDLALDRPSPDFSRSSSSSSPLQFFMSPPDPPRCDTMKPAPPNYLAPSDIAEEKQHLSHSADGRLEDFLESATGKPLLGVEPGGVLTLIDDLHSQLLCTPSIVDNPSVPMGEGEEDSTDWLGLTMEGVKEEESTLAPLVPEKPLSVFSADFLDSADLHTHWDACM